MRSEELADNVNRRLFMVGHGLNADDVAFGIRVGEAKCARLLRPDGGKSIGFWEEAVHSLGWAALRKVLGDVLRAPVDAIETCVVQPHGHWR